MKVNNGKSKNFSYKILTLGDQFVGKTSLIERYVNNSFRSNYLLTIGMDKRNKRLDINGNDIDIFITDTAGEERFRAITKMFYKQADGILVGFSLTEKNSLESVNYWIEQIQANCSKEYPVSLVLVGNKCDDKDNIQVGKKEIDELKQKYGLEYFETSAKENINVKEVFEYLTKLVIKSRGNLKDLGYKNDVNFEEIIIKEKENQKIEEYKKIPKKKKFC